MEKINLKKFIMDWCIPVLVTALGTAIVAVGLYFFLIPTTISPGGVSGISIIVNTLTGFPVKWSNLIINVPLFIFGGRLLGKKCAALTLEATILLSVFLSAVEHIFPVGVMNIGDDMILAAIFGGVTVGLGLGMVFKVGGTTGGTDLAGAMISNSFPKFSIAKGMALFDFFIVVSTGIVTGDPKTVLYSLIAVFFCMRLPDMIMNNYEYYKAFMIISNEPEKVGQALMSELSRGVTIIKGAGMYSKQDKPILLCVVQRAQFTKAKDLIHKYDEKAFIMIVDMKEVFGEGFLAVKNNGKNNKGSGEKTRPV